MKKLLLCVLLLLLPYAALADLEVHFLDMGHGECTILVCDGEAMIVDGGPASSSDLIFTCLRDLGVTELKYAIATYPDADHVGGLPAAFHAAEVCALYTSVTAYDDSRFRVLLDKAEEMDVPIILPAAGDVLTLGGAAVTILSPKQTAAEVASIALHVTYGNRAFLLCGYADGQVETSLLTGGMAATADVIRISQHDGSGVNTVAFLRAVNASYAVLSCPERRNIPERDVMDRLLALHTIPLCTDYVGDVVIHTDGQEMTIWTESYYVANLNSEVYHRMTCSSVKKMKESNKYVVYSGEQAEYEGYRTCKNCSP